MVFSPETGEAKQNAAFGLRPIVLRVNDGAEIPAAAQAFALLIDRIAAIAALERLAITIDEAADLIWASANAAALLQ